MQRIILDKHFTNPEMTRRQIAVSLDCNPNTVSAVFGSLGFNKIIEEATRQQLREIDLLAVRRIREALDSPQQGIRVDTAVKLLRSQGTMSDLPKTLKQDNKILVTWGEPEPAAKAKIRRLVNTTLNGSSNKLHAAPEPVTSTQIES